MSTFLPPFVRSCSRAGRQEEGKSVKKRYNISCLSHRMRCATPLALSSNSLIVRNLSDRLRTLSRMKMNAQRRLAALRAVAEKNEEAAQANTIDDLDNEAVEAVRGNNRRERVFVHDPCHYSFTRVECCGSVACR